MKSSLVSRCCALKTDQMAKIECAQTFFVGFDNAYSGLRRLDDEPSRFIFFNVINMLN